MKKFNIDQFTNSLEFEAFYNKAVLSMDGKDGFYTRKDAFKSGVMVAYYLLSNKEIVSISDYEILERQDELNRAKIRQLESQLLAKSHILY
jgi:hypothetical protein